MNAFQVSQTENEKYQYWLYAAIVCTLLTAINTPTTVPISGYNGFYALWELVSAKPIKQFAIIATIILTVWMLYKLQMHSMPADRKLGRLWLAYNALFVMRNIFPRLIGHMGHESSLSLIMLSNLISLIAIVIELWVGLHLMLKYKGRLKQLGVALLLVALGSAPLFLLFFALSESGLPHLYLLAQVVNMAFVVYSLVCMRRVFVPTTAENAACDTGNEPELK